MATPKSSPDKGKTVEWYIREKLSEPWQQEMVMQLHELILSLFPDAKHSVKWSQPVYESSEGPAIFMKAAKKHITFGFWRGAEMTDEAGVLEGSGEKMRHLKLKPGSETNNETIKDFVRQAWALNAQFGNPTR